MMPRVFRDNNGFLILSDLEIYKQMEANGQDKDYNKIDDDTLLFNRNWPLTERNKGKSFQEFIKR